MKLIIYLCLIVSLPSVASDVAKDKVLSVVMSGSFPPWNSMTKEGEMIGFEPELMKQVCFRLNRVCQIDSIKSDRLFAAVRFDKYDVGISGVGVTKLMEKVVLTSEPYGKKGYVIVTKKNSFLASDFCDGDLKDACKQQFDVSDFNDSNRVVLTKVSEQLKGYMVGIQVGTSEEWLSKLLNGVNTQKAHTQKDLLKMMKNREVNTVILNNEYWYHLSHLPEYQVYSAIGPVFYGGSLDSKVGIIAKKTKPELLVQVNEVLAELQEDGTIEKLSVKWFGRNINN